MTSDERSHPLTTILELNTTPEVVGETATSAPVRDDTSQLADEPPIADSLGSLGTDVLQSMRNATTLGASLLITWAIALIVRVYLPRHLGPAAFGDFQFADSFTATVFILTGLGIETYVRKEVSTRGAHATEFFGGTTLVRLALGVIVMVGSVWGLGASGRPVATRELVFILGVMQILVTVNLTYAALLHAAGKVDGLSALNVLSKLLWGGGILAVFASGGGVRGVAVAMLLSEAVRTVGLGVLSRRHTGLRFHVDLVSTRAVIVASLPFYLATLATTVYSKIDVSIMSYQTTNLEVGWYGAASTLAGMAMLISPLIMWVLLPLTSRAAGRSEDEFLQVGRRAMELVLAASLPLSLFMYLSADVVINLLFGSSFAPAAASMRLQAPVFVLTYVAIVSCSLLIRLERGWAVTWISVGGMLLSPLLNCFLIPLGLARYGRGGAGVGAAIALVVTELATTIAVTWLLGGRAFDRRSIVALAKTVVVCGVVVLLDILLRGLGPARLLLDGIAYFVGVIAWGALDPRGMISMVRSSRSGRVAASEA